MHFLNPGHTIKPFLWNMQLVPPKLGIGEMRAQFAFKSICKLTYVRKHPLQAPKRSRSFSEELPHSGTHANTAMRCWSSYIYVTGRGPWHRFTNDIKIRGGDKGSSIGKGGQLHTPSPHNVSRFPQVNPIKVWGNFDCWSAEFISRLLLTILLCHNRRSNYWPRESLS